ncbi:MAG: F0F1 ATP synthase subunit A [Metamycoplasmataceae bacterium]
MSINNLNVNVIEQMQKEEINPLFQNWNQWNQPQLFSLFVVVTFCFIFSLYIYIKLKIYSKADKAPKGILLIMEEYLVYVTDTYDDITEKKIPHLKFYIFSLVSFLIVGNLISIFGLEPIASSYSITLTLALITWLGIYVIGIWFQKWRFFKKFLMPTDLVGQFAPLISLSLRMFGNIVGGGTIVFLLYYSLGSLWTLIFKTSDTHWARFLFAPLLAPFFHMYFDIFGAFMQAMVFTILTSIYWASEAVRIEKKVKKISKTETKVVNVLETQKNIY